MLALLLSSWYTRSAGNLREVCCFFCFYLDFNWDPDISILFFKRFFSPLTVLTEQPEPRSEDLLQASVLPACWAHTDAGPGTQTCCPASACNQQGRQRDTRSWPGTSALMAWSWYNSTTWGLNNSIRLQECMKVISFGAEIISECLQIPNLHLRSTLT